MTTAIGDTIWYTIMGGQLVVSGWVAVRRRSMWPVLSINLLVAIAVLFVVLPNFLGELAYISSGAASELLDYLSVILTSFEAVVIVASGFALLGVSVRENHCLARLRRKFCTDRGRGAVLHEL